MKLLNFLNKTIEYSFYLLFFLVPLAFTGDTSELFEFNKLWVTFTLTIIIGFAWIVKMIIKKEFLVQRTLLDIPIGLFLVSQIISTFISLDTHVSLWGYYSRFNGGLFSILAYIFLYYAFVSNLKGEEKDLKTKGAESFKVKQIYFFIGAVAVFIIGALVSSQIKNVENAGMPFQLFSTLATVLVSFAIFMKAAPFGTIKRSLYAIFSSAFLVLLWGLPSHFGYDPTCLLFRGSFDVACWTNDFQPKVRIFSTLGQPDWLAAYLTVLIPIITAIFINFVSQVKLTGKKFSLLKDIEFLKLAAYFLFFAFAYLALLYTKSRSAVLATLITVPLLLFWYLWFHVKPKFDKKNLTSDFKSVILLFLTLAVVTFIAGLPFVRLEKFTLSGIGQNFFKPSPVKTVAKPVPSPTPAPIVGELGGTDSGKIRLFVWRGALDIWKNYPVFGSGLETYAFAYYKYRPTGHNLTSEWQFLYNKAHNEFLNYAATTGTLGIGTYLLMIGSFIFLTLRYLLRKKNKLTKQDFLIVSFLAGYGAILITNFFGFSVVMINIFFYLIPAFVLILTELIDYKKTYGISLTDKESYVLGMPRKILIGTTGLISLYLLFTLINFWNADRNFYFGSNYNRGGDYQKAYASLKNAVALRPSEPTFQDEFAYNNVILASAIINQSKQKTDKQQDEQQNLQLAKQFVETGVNLSNKITTEHPNNIVSWKTKVRIYYALSQLDPAYLPMALTAIKQAAVLAPTDADVSYNMGILYGQTGDSKNAIATLQNTIKLKPNYPNPHYALGIFYHSLAVDAQGKLINEDYNQKAISEMKYILKTFGPNEQASQALATWSKK